MSFKDHYQLGQRRKKMIKKLIKFIKDEDGVTAVEYAVMAALIALVVIAGATILGTSTNDTFDTVANAIPS
jgi:pilus assembly protein Flp/PilA